MRSITARNVSSDVRNYYIHKLMSANIRSTAHHIYPRLMALHDLDDTIALPDANGSISMPALMRDSHFFMQAHGIYLIGVPFLHFTPRERQKILTVAVLRQRGSHDLLGWLQRVPSTPERFIRNRRYNVTKHIHGKPQEFLSSPPLVHSFPC